MNSEYKSCLKQLNDENKKLVKKIALYIESRNLNGVAGEELLGDIAGMALECQKRNESFSEQIGDYQDFARALVKNSPRRNAAETLFWIFAWIVGAVGAIVPLLWITEFITPDFTPAKNNGLEFIAPIAYIIKYTVFVGGAMLGWFAAFRLSYRSRTAVMSIYIAILIFSFAVFSVSTSLIPSSPSCTVNILLWCVILTLAVFVCLLAKHLTALTVAYNRARKQRKLNLY